MSKTEIQTEKGKNILNNPDERKKFKSQLSAITQYFQQIDDLKEGVKDTVVELSQVYGLDKKLIRKLAVTMYKHDYANRVEEDNHFRELYEIILAGKKYVPEDSSDEDDDSDSEE